MKDLATYVEQISDNFGSTFCIAHKNKLINMLGFNKDFEILTKIIQSYIPHAKIKYTKLHHFANDYDMYSIELLDKDNDA